MTRPVPFLVLPACAVASAQTPSKLVSPDSDCADHISAAQAPNGDLYLAWISYEQQGADTRRLRRRISSGREELIDASPVSSGLDPDRRGEKASKELVDLQWSCPPPAFRFGTYKGGSSLLFRL